MANNKISDSVDETAFQALEDALQLGAFEEKAGIAENRSAKAAGGQIEGSKQTDPCSRGRRACACRTGALIAQSGSGQ